MDWDKVKVFHAVAEAGSFTHAGEILNLSQSSVSRQVGALERSLNAALFHRHARGAQADRDRRDPLQDSKGGFCQIRHGRGDGE